MIAKSNHLKTPKGFATDLPLEQMKAQPFLFVPETNFRCAKADVAIQPGERVLFAQQVGMRHGPFFDQPIFSPCSGVYVGEEKHGYRNGKTVTYLKFQNDFKDELDPNRKPRSEEEVAALTQADLVNILKDNACVGLGGSSFPSYIKANTKDKINTILINGVECEPSVTADHRLLSDVEQLKLVLKGIAVLENVYGTHDARICIKSKHKELVPYFEQAKAEVPGCDVQMQLLGSFYPQGWELAMIEKATSIVVKPGTLPAKYGILDFNVTSMLQLYRAVYLNLPIMDRVINVNGDEIVSPKALLTRVGTPFSALIEACGGYKSADKEKTLIVGGPMMGSTIPSDDCVTTRTVTSILVSDKKEYQEEPCIRCGSCVLACPAHLEPVLVMRAMKTMPVDRAKVKSLNPLSCVECGMCSYVCTSRIPLTDYMRRAKIVAKLP